MPLFESFSKELYNGIYALTKILEEYNIEFCVIGGASVFEYGYERITEDIDILVKREDKQKLLSIPPSFIQNISNGRRLKLHDPEIPIDVVYTGDNAGNFLSKYSLTFKDLYWKNSIPFITLTKLIIIKLSIGLSSKHREYKDLNDVQTLIEVNALPYDYLDNEDINETLIANYKLLWNRAY